MMRFQLITALSLLTALTFTQGCGNVPVQKISERPQPVDPIDPIIDPPVMETGELQLASLDAKGLSPFKITRYHLTMLMTTDKSQVIDQEGELNEKTEIKVTKLKAGKWSLVLEFLDAKKEITLKGSVEVEIKAGEVTKAEIKMELVDKTGTIIIQPILPPPPPPPVPQEDCPKDLVVASELEKANSKELEVCGNILTDTVWSKKSGIIHVTCPSYLYEGKSLRVMPGTQVIFDAKATLELRGQFFVCGTKTNQVTFTGKSKDTQSGLSALSLVTTKKGAETNQLAKGLIKFAKFSNFLTAITTMGQISLRIEDSTFENNNVGVTCHSFGGKSSGVNIVNSRFEKNGLGVSSADGIEQSTFRGHTQAAVTLDDFSTVANSVFENNEYGVKAGGHNGGEVVNRSTFSKNKVAILIGRPTNIIESKISENEQGIIIVGYDESVMFDDFKNPPLHGNQLGNNTKANIVLKSRYDLDASGNFWGTTKEADIAPKILDGHNQLGGMGFVTFKPFLTKAPK